METTSNLDENFVFSYNTYVQRSKRKVTDVRTETFKSVSSTRVLLTENTTDFYSKSMISCAHICLSDHQCCLVSFSKETSPCHIDSSGRCCIETEPLERWRFIQRNSYISMTYKGCINFGNSSYFIFEEHIGWDKAKENCERLGGKLAELETLEENEFIKEVVRSRNARVEGYWIGGYNFHKDLDMEWVSQPNQTMPFCDMESGQPNGPQDQLCMVTWKEFDFRWDDRFCVTLLTYICEFMHH